MDRDKLKVEWYSLFLSSAVISDKALKKKKTVQKSKSGNLKIWNGRGNCFSSYILVCRLKNTTYSYKRASLLYMKKLSTNESKDNLQFLFFKLLLCFVWFVFLNFHKLGLKLKHLNSSLVMITWYSTFLAGFYFILSYAYHKTRVQTLPCVISCIIAYIILLKKYNATSFPGLFTFISHS